MATTVRFGDGEREKIERGYIRAVGMDLWYKAAPFWYKHNQHGTWEMYTTEEMDSLVDKGHYPKFYTMALQEILNSTWRVK